MGRELDIAAFFDQKGAIGFLVQLDKEEGSSFGDLREKVHVSHTTLSNLKDDALELDLVTEGRKPDDHGNTRRYELTKRGEVIRKELEKYNIHEHYRDFLHAHRAMKEGKEEIKEWLEDSVVTYHSYPPERDHPDERPR